MSTHPPDGTLERDQKVFLNVPYKPSYEPLFVSLISGLVALGRTPMCALESSEFGEGRMSKILAKMEPCALSIDDLSYAGTPVRFNMPFELGIAYEMRRQNGDHEFVLFEKIPYRLDRTLSDMKGHDPHIHNGSPTRLLNRLIDVLGSEPGTTTEEAVRVWRQVRKHVNTIKKSHQEESIYTPRMFRTILAAAVDVCEKNGLLEA